MNHEFDVIDESNIKGIWTTGSSCGLCKTNIRVHLIKESLRFCKLCQQIAYLEVLQNRLKIDLKEHLNNKMLALKLTEE